MRWLDIGYIIKPYYGFTYSYMHSAVSRLRPVATCVCMVQGPLSNDKPAVTTPHRNSYIGRGDWRYNVQRFIAALILTVQRRSSQHSRPMHSHRRNGRWNAGVLHTFKCEIATLCWPIARLALGLLDVLCVTCRRMRSPGLARISSVPSVRSATSVRDRWSRCACMHPGSGHSACAELRPYPRVRDLPPPPPTRPPPRMHRDRALGAQKSVYRRPHGLIALICQRGQVVKSYKRRAPPATIVPTATSSGGPCLGGAAHALAAQRMP